MHNRPRSYYKNVRLLIDGSLLFKIYFVAEKGLLKKIDQTRPENWSGQIFSEVGGPTIVGSDVPEKIFSSP